MKLSFLFFFILLFFTACKDKPEAGAKEESAIKFPGAATSVESVKQLITGKYFVAVKAGLFIPAAGGKETPYEWLDESRDTSSFTKEFLDKEMSLELLFNHDSTGIIFYDKQWSFDSTGASVQVKKHTGMTYRVEEEDSEPGIKLQLIEEHWNNFDGRTEKLGSTYIVTGADENGLVLEAPRGYLDKKVVVMLVPKERR